MSEDPGPRPSSWLGSAALVLLVLAIYWQTRQFGFTDFDDPQYVTDNPMVLGGLTWAGVRWAFTTGATGNWHPLTWLSHLLDVTLFGVSARGPHLVNAALHAVNAVLLFRLLDRMTGARRPSLAVACLFAVHPLHVESVAWIAERKDVLSTGFGLLSLLAYVRHAEKPDRRWFGASLGAFVLSLMAKATLVTLPVLLLLLDRWPLGRRRPLEKLPFFGVAAGFAVLTFWVQRANGNMSSLQAHPLGPRAANAAWSALQYLRMMAWPTGLAAFHPFPAAGLAWKGGLASVILAALTLGAFRSRLRRPYLWLGWAWFLVTLLPVIGLVQVGTQGMADRYTYLPLVGPFLALAWWARDLGRPRLAAAGFTAVLAGCTGLAWAQTATWKDSVTLFTHAARSGNDCALVRKNLAMGHYLEGHYEPAEREYRTALAMAPGDALGHAGLGKVLWAAGRREEALEEYRQALRCRPGDPDNLYRLGRALAVLGRREEALDPLGAFLRTGAGDRAMVRDARMLSGLILRSLGRPGEACPCFAAIVAENPADRVAQFQFHLATGAFLLQNGRLPEAREAFRRALALAPGNTEATLGLKAGGG